MSKFGIIEDTLFIPMLGRIYSSEHCPQILYDQTALELKDKIPPSLLKQHSQSQYTMMASAVRSANMDRFIRSFLQRNANGVIVQLGCGLETTYSRCNTGRTRWYAVDLPHVIAYRQCLLPEQAQETYLSSDAFSTDWIRQVRTDVPNAPLLVTAAGLFHYFEEDKVLGLLRTLTTFGDMEIVFDAVSKRGMAMMQKKYMRQVGHADARMFFYVDSVAELAGKIGGGTKVLVQEPYYRHIPRGGLQFFTKVSMAVSDRGCMVKMIHLKL